MSDNDSVNVMYLFFSPTSCPTVISVSVVVSADIVCNYWLFSRFLLGNTFFLQLFFLFSLLLIFPHNSLERIHFVLVFKIRSIKMILCFFFFSHYFIFQVLHYKSHLCFFPCADCPLTFPSLTFFLSGIFLPLTSGHDWDILQILIHLSVIFQTSLLISAVLNHILHQLLCLPLYSTNPRRLWYVMYSSILQRAYLTRLICIWNFLLSFSNDIIIIPIVLTESLCINICASILWMSQVDWHDM